MQIALDRAFGAVGTAGVDRPMRIQSALGSGGVGLNRRHGRAVHATAVGNTDGIANGNIALMESDLRSGSITVTSCHSELARSRGIRMLKAVDLHGFRLRLVGNGDLETSLHLIQLALQRGDVALLHLNSVGHRKHVQRKLGTGEGKFLRLVGFDERQRIVALTAVDGQGVVGRAHIRGVDLVIGKHLAVTSLEILVWVVRDVTGDLINILCHCESNLLHGSMIVMFSPFFRA